MTESWNWDDLRLFLAVARTGTLAKASPLVRASAPTLIRRLRSLEQALGSALFVRHRDGYDLTAAGKELLELAESFERGALSIDRWRTEADPSQVIKIAAGGWTSVFIARHMSHLIGGDDKLSIEILTGVSPADLLRREANLGLRNHRPVTPGLAGRRLVRVEFAVYGAASLVRSRPQARDERRFITCPWIAFAPPGPKTPSAEWLDQKRQHQPRLTCSTTQTVLEATAAGVGLAVLPCFIGDTEPGLSRASGIIGELGHDQWLVSHDDDRHAKQIRQVSGRLTKLIRSHERLFRGQLST